jgi:hypothetical protein
MNQNNPIAELNKWRLFGQIQCLERIFNSVIYFLKYLKSNSYFNIKF